MPHDSREAANSAPAPVAAPAADAASGAALAPSGAAGGDALAPNGEAGRTAPASTASAASASSKRKRPRKPPAAGVFVSTPVTLLREPPRVSAPRPPPPPPSMGGAGGLAQFAEEADRIGAAAHELSRAALALSSPRGFRFTSDFTVDALILWLETFGIGSAGLSEDDIVRMRNILEEFCRLPPEDRMFDRLYELVRLEYGPDVPESHVRLIYDKCFRLLRNISSGELSLPQLLLDVARYLFDNGEPLGGTEEPAETDEMSEMPPSPEVASGETLACARPIAGQEMQTQPRLHASLSPERQAARVDPSQARVSFSNTNLIFERPAVAMSSADVDLNGIQCDITVTHMPFRHGPGSRRLWNHPKSTAIVPNFKTVMAIIKYNAMPSPQLDLQKGQLINLLQTYENDRLILLMTSVTLTIKAVYRMERSGDTTIVKIWGVGPQKLTEKDIGTFWKYDFETKQIEPIPTRHFTQTTDCVSLKRAVEPRNW
jgi:hypothetical protein